MYTWKSECVSITEDGRCMPFRPVDKYVSQQNPPTFTWPYVAGAEYDLIICSDNKLSNVKYSKNRLKDNFCSFENVFEKGVCLYWSVRYCINSNYSEWSEPRRFRISPEAWDFPVENVDSLIDKIPLSHPRIWTTKEKLEEFRNYKNANETTKKAFDTVIEKAKAYVQKGEIPKEPEWKAFDLMSDYYVWIQKLRGESNKLINIVEYCSFAYLLTGDKEIGNFGIKALMELSGWDIEGPTGYKNQDQVHRCIAYQSAMAYDWLYDLMTESQRAKALNMIEERCEAMIYLIKSLRKMPYESHGWTAIGYIGIISIATLGEIDEARQWLKKIIPIYTALLPPWSYEDGGWSQGTDYWQYSSHFNKEFMDVLAMAGIINLYNKAWQKNEYLWAMYAYPGGSYGSFGAQSNWHKAGNYSVDALCHTVAMTKDPIVKWLTDQCGKLEINQLYHYYTALADSIHGTTPKNYPLAHEFKDIGWIIMIDSVVDPDRIQFSFKSSPYGSFNHSEADQNSFIIQAYGENLAVKGGWYDYCGSTHDVGFTRTTAAHNSVTVKLNKGQADGRLDSCGELTGFINHIDFDLASGDATKAYFGVLKKFERSVIYIRPNLFIIIDELEASEDDGSEFEWWLNANHDIEIYNDKTGARLQEGRAVLDAVVHYPNIKNVQTIHKYAGSDLKEYPTERYKDFNVQRRVWFETEKVKKTKIVTTLDVHKADEEEKYVKSECFENYLKLSFEDGTVAFINISNNEDLVCTENIQFRGTAVIYNKNSIMLVSGTELSIDKKVIIKANGKLSLAAGKGRLEISTYEDNTFCLNVNNNYINNVKNITNANGTVVDEKYGIVFEKDLNNDFISVTVQKDNYSLRIK